jgi:antitoxin YefM
MYTVYRLHADELDEQFLQALKMLFANREIEIVVTEVDETAYLLQEDANRERLLRAVGNVEKSQGLIAVDLACPYHYSR